MAAESIGRVTVLGDAHVVMPARPVSWPVQIGKPPNLAASFQPRHHAREQVHARWQDTSRAQGTDGACTVLITGPSGVGKTQLAARLFHEAGAEGTDLRMWVRADSRASVMASFMEAAERVQAPGWDSSEAETKAEAFLSWLSTTDRSWLVVFDNVVTPAELKGLWPTGRGRVLATTFVQSLAVLPGADARVKLGVFAPEEARSYMVRRVQEAVQNGEDTTPNVLEGATGLAEDLGFLPVALAQAISVVLHEAASCVDYRKDFADRSNRLEDLFPERLPADEYERTVATTWSLAMEQTEGIVPVGLASGLVQLAAAADPGGAPDVAFLAEPSLVYLADRLTPREGTVPSVTAKKVRSALRHLHSLSLIEHQPGDVAIVRMHMLTQRAVLESDSTYGREGKCLALADSLETVWDTVEIPAKTLLLANAEHLIKTSPEDIWWHDGPHPMLHRAVGSMLNSGMATNAIEHLQWMLTHATEQLGPECPVTLAIRNNLAYAYQSTGQLDEAIIQYEAVLDTYQRDLGPDHPPALITRNNLALAYREAGRLQEAIAEHEAVLNDCQRVLGPDHPDTLITRNFLAYAYQSAGRLQEAIAEHEAVLNDCQRVLGPDH
ncbi:tetratricopeptide repeat protein, partial [Kocuria sp. CH-021]|uniref:tetratricopeptide repeat protein n=1 Tax=Kocuria sp. CH-021 TaxID=3406735 RepID=UPI003C72CE1C